MNKIRSDSEINFKNLFKNTLYNFNHSIIPILIFQILFNILLFIIINPLIKILIKLFIRSSNTPILFNERLPQFIFSMSGLFTILLFSFIGILIVFFEFSVILIMIDKGIKGEKISIIDCIILGFSKIPLIINFDFISFAVYGLVLIPIFGIGLQSSFLPQIIIPNFILDEVLKYSGGKILLGFFIALGISIFIRLLFVLPVIVFEDKRFKEAARESKSITSGYIIKIGLLLFSFLSIWSLVGIIPIIILSKFKGIVFDIIIIIFFLFYIFTIITINPFILNLVMILYKKINKEYRLKKLDRFKIVEIMNNLNSEFKSRIKNIWKIIKNMPILSVFIIGLIVLNISIGITDDSEYIYPEKSLIIGHRGSLVGVENTIESTLEAGRVGADYAEIDILLSKDNIPMVIHDNNLGRLSGKNLNISDLNAEEIKDIQISGRGYTGNISTLEDFFNMTEDNIELLIELKTHGKENASVVKETIKVLENKNTDKTIFQTTEYNILLEMKEDFPDKKIGYIIIGKLGWLDSDYVKEIPADFLVFEESMVRKSLVKTVHSGDKEIFAWTINNKDIAKELLEMRVDGIITDYPEDMLIIREDIIIKQ